MPAQTVRLDPVAAPAAAPRLTSAEVIDLVKSIWFYSILVVGFAVPVLMPIYALLTR